MPEVKVDSEWSFGFVEGTPDVTVVGAVCMAIEPGLILSTGPVGVLPIAVLHSTEGGFLWDSFKMKVTTSCDLVSPGVSSECSGESVVVPSCI